jgi:hypothetical protein
MSVNPVSGVPTPPSIPPRNEGIATAAAGAIFLGRLADTAGAMAVSGVGAVGNAQDALMNAQLQAVTDLAEIHMYLYGANPDPAKALAAANDFIALAQQYGFTNRNANPSISQLTTQVQNYLQISNGQVTGFKADAAGKTFNDWWGTGTDTNNQTPGVTLAFTALSTFLKQDIAFGPGLPPFGYPQVLVNVCVIYADLLSTPQGKVLNGVEFWNAVNPNTAFSFGTLFPYAMATYAQYMSSQGQGNVDDMMNNMYSLLSEVKPYEGVGSSDYTSMLTEFSALKNAMQTSPGGWPLPQVPGPSQAGYNYYKSLAGTDSQTGISNVYNFIFQKMYIAWLQT